MVSLVLSLLALALAALALTRRRLLWGIAILGVHSLVLAGLYFSLSAPDVALTEAAIGFALVTFVYLLAIRRTGRIVVAAVECPSLIYWEGGRETGLIPEILEVLSARTHRELEIRWVERDEVRELLASSEADLAVGDIVPSSAEMDLPSVDLFPTRIVRVSLRPGREGAVRGSREAELLGKDKRLYPHRGALQRALERGEIGSAIVNLLELRSLYLRSGIREAEVTHLEDASFAMLFAPDEEELAASVAEILAELRESGRWDELLRRYL